MRILWNKISYLGIQEKDTGLERRTMILSNQLNFIMLITMILALIFLSVMREIEGSAFGIGSLRVLLLLIFNLINIALSYFKYTKLSKILLIFISPLIFLIFPTLIGFVEEESFIYYPFILIAFSILPQLLFVLDREKLMYRISIAYYGLLLLFMEKILIAFMPENFAIVKIIEEFYVYIKVVQMGSFIFLQFAVFYLRKLNINFEQDLNDKNKILDEQNEELKKSISRLKITQRQLIQLEKMSAISTLTSGVAHEINNPLNFISGGLDLLNENDIKEELSTKSRALDDYNTAIHIIREGVIRASKIVDTLMNFSYKSQSILEPMDIHQIIENTLLFCNANIPATISIKKDYHLKYDVPVYQDKIHQVILAIVENAIASIQSKITSDKEIISFYTSDAEFNGEKNAIIRIENTGPNIPEDIIDKIFEPFFTTRDPGEGTGLGLSIAYSFLKDHSGTIEVENTKDGVSFNIKLPIKC